MTLSQGGVVRGAVITSLMCLASLAAQQGSRPGAVVDGTEPGWRALGAADFDGVNGGRDTWIWAGEELHSSGKPIGVLRTRDTVTNLELMIEWRHLESGGNSGVFVWVPPAALASLEPGMLPDYGIEGADARPRICCRL